MLGLLDHAPRGFADEVALAVLAMAELPEAESRRALSLLRFPPETGSGALALWDWIAEPARARAEANLERLRDVDDLDVAPPAAAYLAAFRFTGRERDRLSAWWRELERTRRERAEGR